MENLSIQNSNDKSINSCINQFLKELRNLHFSEFTIKVYENHLNKFMLFCKSNNYKDFLSDAVISKYLDSIFNLSSKNIQYARKVLGRFKDFTLTKHFKTKYLSLKYNLTSSIFSSALDSFDKFLSNSAISIHTRKHQYQVVRNFLISLETSHILTFKNFSLNYVTKYINNSNYSHSSKCWLANVLKKFFNYTSSQKITNFSGNELFPKIKRNYHERIPSFYSIDEISRLLSVVDTNSKTGKRNYAIIILAASLAFRASDIVNLTLENIDWDNKLIKITQQKTKKELIQPFTDEIYYALLDYLKNARPQTNCNNIFVSLKPPYQALTTSALYLLTSNYFKLANIDISGKKHGIHALRHSLSNNLLHNNVSLQDISASMGHSLISTTTMYINIDIKTLKLLSLEV